MQTYYTKWYSPSVGREMEIKVYGHAGRPVLFIPCQDGRFFDFENYRMTDAWAPWIESGQCMVFSIDTLDKETYSATYDPHDRIRRHEAWMNYIVREVAPFIQSMTNERNGWDGTPGIIAFGCSLGATHAANLYFRFPETFDGLLALSGIYTSEYGRSSSSRCSSRSMVCSAVLSSVRCSAQSFSFPMVARLSRCLLRYRSILAVSVTVTR